MEKEEVFSVEGNEAAAVFGQFDCNVKKIEKEFNVSIVNRGDYIKISGERSKEAAKTIECLLKAVKNNVEITEQSLNYTIDSVKNTMRTMHKA